MAGCINGGTEKQEKNNAPVMRDYSLIIQAAIMKILKNSKNMPKKALSTLVGTAVKIFRPSLEQINQAITTLSNKNEIEIDTKKGIIKYLE